MKLSILFKPMTAVLLGIVMGVGITPAFAVDGADPNATLPNLFELDGNTLDEYPEPPDPLDGLPDDWGYLYACSNTDPPSCGDTPYEFTGILPDPAPVTIYTTGGSKDVYDIDSWKWKDGSVPDKDDITNAYAAAYVNPEDICYEDGVIVPCEEGDEIVHYAGDLIIYFGLDRYDNSGDAFAGFWFLQNSVGLDYDGMVFTDVHVAKNDEGGRGDILVLVEYPQGSNAVPVIKAYEYDPMDFGDPNVDEDGKSIGPLEMIYSSANGMSTALCDGYGGKLACAITNLEDGETPAWPYLSKDGTDWFPYETFYEGGINLTELLGGQNICVHTFLAETRSSRSETAQLKDFVLGAFELCGSRIRTEVHDPSHNDVTMWDPMDYTKVMAGTALHDFAEVEIIVPGVRMDPEGDVEFRLFKGLDCTIPALDEYDEPLVWTIEIDPDIDPMGNGELDDYLGWAETPSMELPAAADYSFIAKFLSDFPEYFPDVTAACEPFSIDKYPSYITTQIHSGSTHTPDIQGTPDIKVGISVHDHAYVAVLGMYPGAPVPTGDVIFNIWEGSTCGVNEPPIPNALPITGQYPEGSGVLWPQTGALGTPLAGQAVTALFTPEGNSSFSIRASYAGDLNFFGATDSGCEPLTVNKYDPSILTKVKVRDLAEVTGAGPAPTGEVWFTTYSDQTCSSYVSGPVKVSLSSGAAELAVDTVLGPSTDWVSYKAEYKGDDNYNPVIHDCEVVGFSLYVPTP